jgi:hypothetical protein
MMIKPQVKKADAKNNAQYIVSVTWPDNNLDDIDTWLESPDGKLVWFRDKDGSMAHLDRDDLGMQHDVVTLSDGSVVTNPRNQEIVTIRGFIAGEWVLNIHTYKKREEQPTPVKVSIDRVNPVFKTLFFREIVMETGWQEETVTRFEMLPSGEILSWDNLPKQLVKAENVYEGGEH